MLSTQSLQKSAFWLLCLALFSPFLVISNEYVFPFIVPKILFFRICTLLAFSAYVLLFLADKEFFRPRKTWVGISVCIFFASLIISTFFSLDSYRSFWDGHERMLGLFSLLHYGFFFLVLSSLRLNRERWRTFFKVALYFFGTIIFFGIIQKYLDHDFLLNRGSTTRVSSTLGNSIYLSGLGLFVLALGSYLSIGVKHKLSRFAYYGSALLGFWGILLGGTRGTMLGLISSLGVSALILSFSKASTSRIKIASRVSCVIGVLLLVGFFIFKNEPWLRGLPYIGTLAATEIKSGTANTRLMAWEVAVESFENRPIFGSGLNTYFYNFNEHYNPKFLRHGWGETWFDNAHSVLMNTLSTQGLFGVLAYLALFVSSFVVIRKSLVSGRISLTESVVWSGFLVGHFVHNLFVFENITSYIYLFALLAYLSGLEIGEKVDGSSLPEKKLVMREHFLAMLAIALLFVYIGNVQPKKANTATLRFLQTVSQKANSPMSELIDEAEELLAMPTPHKDDIRADLGRALSSFVPNLAAQGKIQDALLVADFVIKITKDNINTHQFDVRNHLLLAQTLQQKAEITKESRFVLDAVNILEDARSKSPKRQQILFSLSVAYGQLGQKDKAVAIIREAIEFDRTIGESWWRLAALYQALGEIDQAKEVILEAEREGVSFSGTAGEAFVLSIKNTTGTGK